VTRRAFLQGSALAGFAAFLAACGTEGTGTASPSASAEASVAASAEPSVSPTPLGGNLNFANWIGYIDVSEDQTTHPTLDKFTAETGVKVNYVEAVDDNETFFTRDLQGPLSQSLPTQWDIFVVTDWMVARLARLDWLEAIDSASTPNFPANLLEQY